MVTGYLFYIKTNKFLLILLTLSFVALFLNNSIVQKQQERFLMEDFNELVESRESENMIFGSVQFTYFVNSISTFFGHFPTINLTKTPPVKNLCASGLMIKVMFNIFFLFGTYFILRKKLWILLPFVLFILSENISLISIFEALELRKSLPHYPFIYLIIFWFMYKLESNKNSMYYSKFRYVYLNVFLVFNLVIITYWNLR
jgi:hypothetical protein